MKKRVLITGASGFVGFHLVNDAIEQGYEVYAAVRPSSQLGHFDGLPVNYVTLNFEDRQAIVEVLNNGQFNYIIHAAGTTKAVDQEEYDKVNAGYTRNLALAAVQSNIPLEKFIFISSLAALGPLNSDASGLITESSHPGPITAYGKSKLLAELFLKEIGDLPLVTIRPTAVYGPRERDIFIILKSISRGLEPYIGRKAQQLSFIHVSDLSKQIIDALKTGVIGSVYNLSDGHIYDRYALAHFTKLALKKHTLKFHLPLGIVKLMAAGLERIYSTMKKTPALNKEKVAELTAINWACSIKKAEMELGFHPEYDLELGLAQTLKWYKTNNWL